MLKNQTNDRLTSNAFDAAEYIRTLFKKTDSCGILYCPALQTDAWGEMATRFRCKLKWNENDCTTTAIDIKNLCCSLKKLADTVPIDISLNQNEHDISQYGIIDDTELYKIWDCYIRPLEFKDASNEKIDDIQDRFETIEYLKELFSKYSNGSSLSPEEQEFVKQFVNTSVTEEEIDLLNRYSRFVKQEADSRLGSSKFSYDLLIHAARTYKLFILNAPKILIENEIKQLAIAMVLHRYSVSVEALSDFKPKSINKDQFATDEELDELYRPKKTNSRKSLAPLFVYLILKDFSNSRKHLKQQEILTLLSKDPYEITLERKALSRIIHNLQDSDLFVESDKSGTWLEQD